MLIQNALINLFRYQDLSVLPEQLMWKSRTNLYRLKCMSHDQGPEGETHYKSPEMQTGKLEDDFKYDGKVVDRDVVSVNQIKKLIRTFKDKLPFLIPKKK